MIIQGQVGGLQIGAKQTSGNPNLPQGYMAELLSSKAAPDFYTLVKAGVVYFAAAANINPTGFTGGAGGTPAIGIMNPAGSGKDIVVLRTCVGVRTAGTGNNAQDWIWYGGPSTLPTGTATTPRNAYSLQTSGSVATAFVNTAMTSSSALNAIAAIASLGVTGAAAGLNVFPAGDPTLGLVIAQPGTLIAIGASNTGTAMGADVTAFWAELPQ